MNSQLLKRVQSFVWRAGAYSVVAVLTYLQNVGNIAEVNPKVLWSIFLGTLLVYVLNEVTKWLNSQEK